MPKIAAPPKWMLFLLWPFQGESCYPQIEGDLSEEFQYKGLKHGIAAARRWYCREIFRNFAFLTFRWTTIAVIALPLCCIVLGGSIIGPLMDLLRTFVNGLHPQYVTTTQILVLLLIRTIITGLAFAMVCNALRPGHERMIRLVFTAYYLSLSAIWVVNYSDALARSLATPIGLGLFGPVLILAFIWMGGIWMGRHHCVQAAA